MLTRVGPETRRPSSLACTKCRAKHLKCDARSPVCSRCQKNGLLCSYVRSRRGQRTQKESDSIHVVSPSHGSQDQQRFYNSLIENSEIDGSDLEDSEPVAPSFFASSVPGPKPAFSCLWNFGDRPTTTAEFQMPLAIPSPTVEQPVPFSYGSDRCDSRSLAIPPNQHSQSPCDSDDIFVDLFYQNFYPAHPFTIPYRLVRQKKILIPSQLSIAMVFTGSHFTPTIPLLGTREKAIEVLYGQNIEDGYRVQALMLLALVFHARFEEQECLTALRKATDLALRLRMFDRTFATLHDSGNPIIAESWRRTWWELVAIDTLIPTFHPHQYESCLQNIETAIYLPSEERDYANCQPNTHEKTRENFNDRLFLDDMYQHSSFAYKIEAVHLLHAVRCSIAADEDTSVQSIDSSLSNFFVSLPPAKREVVGADGKVDEVLHSALVIANVAALIFHRCQSDFIFLGHRQATQCTTIEAPKAATSTCPQHTSKALRAADNLSNAIGVHLALKTRSPFLTCAIALASSIHLPAYLLPSYSNERHTIRERLQLSISALQMMGEVWPIAQVVKAQIAKFAREVLFETGPGTALPLPRADPELTQAQSVASDDSWLDELSGSGFAADNGLVTDT